MAGELDPRTKDPNEGENRPRGLPELPEYIGLSGACHACGVPVPVENE